MFNTSQKVLIAKMVSHLVIGLRKLFGFDSYIVCRRSGVIWSLDLEEGIDFSIWLLGGFEPRTLKQYKSLVREGDVVLDIGANVGAHTLPFARLVGDRGHVISFEPTQWAFEKQCKNLHLNPELGRRVRQVQALLVAENDETLPSEIYSSWPLVKEEGVHAQHKGRLMTTAGAEVLTLDDAVREIGLARVDFIKIDVDGHEPSVVRGAMDTLKIHQPMILMELAPYVYEADEFDGLLALISEIGYGVFHLTSRKPLPLQSEKLKKYIPEGGAINALLMPLNR